jgi:LmbE family N-acetylglucosaminyl deacetylase
MTPNVIVIVAHPDDAESWAGGTVAKFAQEGRTITYVVVTNGEKGSDDRTMMPERLAGIRRDEQRRAAGLLGVQHVQFLGYPDCEVEDTRELRHDITEQVRRFKPDLLITHDPQRTRNLGVSHRDHRIVGGAALDAVVPECMFPHHETRDIYLIHPADAPNLVIDISETIQLKAEAFACHVSQVKHPAQAMASIRERAARLGQAYGLAYAEGFTRVLTE